MNPDHSLSIGGDVSGSVLVTGSHNLIIQAQQVMLQAAQKAAEQGRDPARMLRVLTLLAAPVLDPQHPESLPEPLDLRQEWENLSDAVRQSHAPILLARLTPPTLEALRAALSPRAELQQAFPHVLHFSGHAWSGGLLLEDEFGQLHRVTSEELVAALGDMPGPLDLVVLNGCETAAAQAVAQALLEQGRARAVVGHPQPVIDQQAVEFARRLYTELTNGFPLRTALANAAKTVTTHRVTLLGDGELCLKGYLQPGEPLVDDRRPPGFLPSRRDFFGRGRELVEIARALERRPRVVALSGPPGIGKSALLLEAAHRNAWRFPGGVTFAEGPDPESGRPGSAAELLAALAGGLKITVPTDQAEQALLGHTAFQPTLLLLDNVESLPADEVSALCRFLERLGAGSAALVASRLPLPALRELPITTPHHLHDGLEERAARRYLALLAERKRIPLKPELAAELIHATAGHPQLLELLAARAGERDLGELLKEVLQRRGDFQAQLERVYDWCAERAGESGRCAWSLLPLFPAGRAPERPLRTLTGEEGLQALRQAALAEFDPRQQAWAWHATVSEYARAHWPLEEGEQLARLAQALTRLEPKNPLLPNAVRWLMVARKEGHWETTQETVWSVLALTDYMVATGELQGDYTAQVYLNGVAIGERRVTPEDVDEPTKLVVSVKELLLGVANELTIGRDSEVGRLYYAAYLRYFLPAEEIPALNRGIIVGRQYFEVDPRTLKPTGRPVNSAKIGDVVQVKLTLIAPSDLHYLVVEDPLPAGFEAVDTSLRTASVAAQAPEFREAGQPEEPDYGYWWSRPWWTYWTHSDLRDEKVALFATYLGRGTYEYTYLMRASLAGEFKTLPRAHLSIGGGLWRKQSIEAAIDPSES